MGRSRPKSKSIPKSIPTKSTSKESQVDKEKIYNTVGEILTDCQNSKRCHTLLLAKLKGLFYGVNSSVVAARTHQTYCASMIWRLMFGLFTSERGDCAENGIQFFLDAVRSIGLEKDVKDFKFPFRDLTPLFIIILKFIHQCHSDIRILVRVRLMEVAKIILEEFHEHPAYTQHRTLRTATYEVLTHRIRDKNHSVRLQALLCLRFYGDILHVRQAITFSARKDPNIEVRRTALKVLSHIPSIKTSVFYEQAFDPSEVVRIEAFKCLVKIPLNKLNKVNQRRKLISWGLTHGSKKIQDIVKNELLPAWLTCSNNSLVVLLTRLELSTKPHIVNLILNSMYKDNAEETISEIDVSFLSTKKVIPVDQLSVEKVQLWFFFCSKFGEIPMGAEKFLPDASDLCAYILEVMQLIHREHEKVIAEGEQEEYTLFLCMALILRITQFITFEEGSRREIQEVVEQILLDPILDECVIINAGMDIAFKVIPKNEYEEFMSKIFKEIFQEAYPVDSFMNTLNQCADENKKAGESQGDVINVDNIVSQDGNMTVVDNVEANFMDNSNLYEGTEDSISIANRREVIKVPFVTSTPYVNPAVARATYKFENLRQEQGIKTLEKIRLGDALERALALHNILEAGQLNIKYKQVCEEEKELMSRLEDARHASDIGFITAQGTAAPRTTTPINQPVSLPITPICSPQHSPQLSQQSFEVEDASNNESRVLKGLAILLRYLILHRKISPVIQLLFDCSIIPCLEDEDSRVRAKIMNIMSVIAILDGTQARTTLLLMYKGVTLEEDKVAKSAAFKSMVDLLVEYEATTFRPVELISEDYDPVPPPLNNPEATLDELQQKFTSIVVSYGGESPTVRDITLRVVAIIKLLLRGRITQVEVIADLLCFWVNPSYAISAICYQIGCWLPIYTSLALENSQRVGKALVISLRRIFDGQEANGDNPKDSEYLKLIDFVLTNISTEVIQKFSGHHVVHEELALEILREINKDVTKRGNAQLARIISFLTIETKRIALQIHTLCATIHESITLFLTVNGIASLKSAVNLIVRKIEKSFDLDSEDDDEILNEAPVQNHDNSNSSLHQSQRYNYNGLRSRSNSITTKSVRSNSSNELVETTSNATTAHGSTTSSNGLDIGGNELPSISISHLRIGNSRQEIDNRLEDSDEQDIYNETDNESIGKVVLLSESDDDEDIIMSQEKESSEQLSMVVWPSDDEEDCEGEIDFSTCIAETGLDGSFQIRRREKRGSPENDVHSKITPTEPTESMEIDTEDEISTEETSKSVRNIRPIVPVPSKSPFAKGPTTRQRRRDKPRK